MALFLSCAVINNIITFPTEPVYFLKTAEQIATLPRAL